MFVLIPGELSNPHLMISMEFQHILRDPSETGQGNVTDKKQRSKPETVSDKHGRFNTNLSYGLNI